MSTPQEAYARYRAEGGWADLSARTKLRLTGEDRVRYLNGQVTANVKKLAPGVALPTCITTAKGKLCGEAWVHAGAGATLLLDAEAELREPLLARLERYIISDDATLEDATEECALFHVLGRPAEELPPMSGGEVVRSRRFGTEGLDVWVPAEEAEAMRGALAAALPELSGPVLESIRLEAGVPAWGTELGEHTLPPEAGLDRTHIDYHKGCYIGQEVISRLKSVGHVNRVLTGFAPAGEVQAGWKIFRPEAPEQAVGELTSVGWSFALAKPLALGYLRRGISEGALLARPAGEAGAAGVPLEIIALPVSLSTP